MREGRIQIFDVAGEELTFVQPTNCFPDQVAADRISIHHLCCGQDTPNRHGNNTGDCERRNEQDHDHEIDTTGLSLEPFEAARIGDILEG